MQELDVDVTRAINALAGLNPNFDQLMVGISNYGVQALVLAVAIQWWRREDRSGIRHVAIAAGFSFLLGLGINQIVLLFVQRMRPYDAGLTNLLIERSNDYSFPSDHATATFAIAAAFLLHDRRPMGCTFALAAASVAFSRVFIGTHYASDVLGGALTGILAAVVVKAAYGKGTRFDNFLTGLL